MWEVLAAIVVWGAKEMTRWEAHQRTEGKKKKLRGLSPQANYTDRAAAAGRRS